jgi:hypothetical protein
MSETERDEEVIVEDVQEDLGAIDLNGDGIPDELEVDDLDDLVGAVNPDDIEEPDDGTE